MDSRRGRSTASSRRRRSVPDKSTTSWKTSILWSTWRERDISGFFVQQTHDAFVWMSFRVLSTTFIVSFRTAQRSRASSYMFRYTFQVVPNRLTVLDDRLHRLKNDRLRHTLHSISTFTFNAVLSPWTLPRRIISPALLSISDCRSSRRLVSRLCARSLALRMPDDPWFFG